MVYLPPEPEFFVNACKRLIDAIDEYDGKPILAEKHNVWLAAVDLEMLSRQHVLTSRTVRSSLWPTARAAFFCALWASREGMPNYKCGPKSFGKRLHQIRSEIREGDGFADCKLAAKWLKVLRRDVLMAMKAGRAPDYFCYQ